MMSTAIGSPPAQSVLEWLRSTIEALQTVPRLKPRHSQETPGQRLAGLRRARGLTQRQLAQLTQISHRMIAYYEAQGDGPPMHVLPKLAQALDVSTDQILGLRPSKGDVPFDTRLWRRLRIIEKLSPADRRAIIKYVEALARQAGISDDDDEI